MPNETYSIADLARLTGVNVRTIRYYLAQGLLPASGESGPGAHYGEGHLHRLRLTKRLQAEHLPLSEIRRRLEQLSDAELAALLAVAEQTPPTPETSALEYIRGVLAPPRHPADPFASSAPVVSAATARAHEPPPSSAPPAPSAAPLAAGRRAGRPDLVGRLRRRATPGSTSEPGAMPRMRDVPAAAPTRALPVAPMVGKAVAEEQPSATNLPERSQWERRALGPNIELHVRRPLSRIEQRRVERLITIARQVLRDDQA